VERVCFLARVRPDRLDEYRERHKSVWPEMRAALAKTGWGNYSIFLADDGLLVGYLETEDYQAALDAMGKTDVNNEPCSFALTPRLDPVGIAKKYKVQAGRPRCPSSSLPTAPRTSLSRGSKRFCTSIRR
jgi:L-rhamnose mutarotase